MSVILQFTELQEQMDQLEHLGLVGGERQDGIDHCLAGIARLSNEVSDATGFIPAYDQRTYSQVNNQHCGHSSFPNLSRPLKL